jgi:translation initiation factor 5A
MSEEGEVKKGDAGSVKPGSFIVMNNMACKVVDVQTSRPGKHGHAKCRITATGLIDGKKYVEVMPGHDAIDIPIIEKKSAQVLSVSGTKANVMDAENYETFDMDIPDELQGQVIEGTNILYWQILKDKVMKQLKSD